MNDKSIKNEFNKNVPEQQKSKPINEKEFNDRLENYKKVTDDVAYKLKIMRYQSDYDKEQTKNEIRETIQLNNLKSGIDRGIHNKNQIKGVESNHALAKETLQQSILKNAKLFYVKTYSLQRNFNEMVKGDDKAIDKEL